MNLKEKLGPINWQFLPTKQHDPADFESFLKLLPKSIEGRRVRHAVEVRHGSFRTGEFVDLLRAYGIGIVLTDKDGFPHIPDVTSSFVYARLQRSSEDEESGYPAQALDLWANGHSQSRERPPRHRTAPLPRRNRQSHERFHLLHQRL
jgi:uncharacterized protein YecE (DUF72 family)